MNVAKGSANPDHNLEGLFKPSILLTIQLHGMLTNHRDQALFLSRLRCPVQGCKIIVDSTWVTLEVRRLAITASGPFRLCFTRGVDRLVECICNYK